MLNDAGVSLTNLSSAIGDVDTVTQEGYPGLVEGILGVLRTDENHELMGGLKTRVTERLIPKVENGLKLSISGTVLVVTQNIALKVKGALGCIVQLGIEPPCHVGPPPIPRTPPYHLGENTLPLGAGILNTEGALIMTLGKLV